MKEISWNADKIHRVYTNYLASNLTTREFAREFGVSVHTLTKAFRSEGLALKGKSSLDLGQNKKRRRPSYERV